MSRPRTYYACALFVCVLAGCQSGEVAKGARVPADASQPSAPSCEQQAACHDAEVFEAGDEPRADASIAGMDAGLLEAGTSGPYDGDTPMSASDGGPAALDAGHEAGGRDADASHASHDAGASSEDASGDGASSETADDAGHADDAGDHAAPLDGGDDAGDGSPPGDPRDARVRFVAPRVVFAGEARVVRLFGTGLAAAAGHPVFAGELAIGPLIGVSDEEARVMLPPLALGEHFLQVGGPPSLDRPGARLFVAPRRHYEPAVIQIPGRLDSSFYDPEREAFFGVFYDEGWSAARIQFDGAAWHVEPIDVPAPISLTMTADGRELLVSAASCTVWHVDPDSLQVTLQASLPLACLYPNEGEIFALADGQVLYTAITPWFTLYEYPSFTTLDAPLHLVTGVLSSDQTRMVWSTSDIFENVRVLYNYRIADDGFDERRPLGSGSFFNSLAISGDGKRFTHYGDVYDGDLRFLGTLNVGERSATVGLSGDGRIAAAFELYETTLRTYAIDGVRGPYQPIGSALELPSDVGGAHHLFLDDRGETAFVFTIGPEYFVVQPLSPISIGHP